VKETLAKIDMGLTFSGTQVMLARFIETWLDGKELSRRPQTVSQYRALAKQHILPKLGGMRLQEIRPAHFKQLYLAKKEEGRGARTVQIVHTVMYAVLKQAVKEGILWRNPASARNGRRWSRLNGIF
jgi:integrase